MELLTRAWLLIFLLSTISAISLSFLCKDSLCESLSSRLTALNTSLLYGLLLQGVHRPLCSRGSLNNRRDDWNLFYHLGGNGPWIEKMDARFGTYDKEGKPPSGCEVDQVHMI